MWWKCEHCGYEFGGIDSTCVQCGAQATCVDESEDDDKTDWYCLDCEIEFEDDVGYCPQCGEMGTEYDPGHVYGPYDFVGDDFAD